jgi:hypothetical protein
MSKMKNTFLKHLHKFAEQTEISRSEMIELTLDYYEPFKIFSRKLDGTRMIREMYSFAGPSGNVRYNYAAKGYMIFYDADKAGFRTIVYRNVYKLEMGGRTYLVR